MPLVIPPGFAQAAIEMRNEFDPDSWFVTFGVEVDLAADPLVDIADGIGQAWAGGWQSSLSNQVTIVGVNLSVGQDGGPPLFVQVPRADQGTQTTEMLPQNCAALISKFSLLGGRRGRGRYYMPGVLKEGQVSQTGIITSGHLADLQAASFTSFANLENGSLGAHPATPMVLLHGTGQSSLPDPSLVVGVSTQQKISTQRRRLR